ncbi:MAG: hypothetical protein KAR39_11750 [Thermoplasmata archaeon]|nr:hypothetical protein [Thermoplasmata archaeon]
MTKKKDNGSKPLSPEVAAIQTVDDFEEGFQRVQYSGAYLKKKITWEGKLLTEWKRSFKVNIPEGATNAELEPVLVTLAKKHHEATTHKHNAEALFLMAQTRYTAVYNKEIDDLTTTKDIVIKGKKKPWSMPVERAKHKARIAPEVSATKQQMIVAEIQLKLWEGILGSLRFTYGVAKNLQMAQMSENKMLGVKGNIL